MPGSWVFLDPGASNSNLNSCNNKNKQSRDKNMEPRIPKDSAHAEPGYKNPNQIRTANHPLKENCER